MIFGSGYVGLVTGACLADAGYDVVCVHVGAAKIAHNRKKGRLTLTTDAKAAVAHGLIQIITVGTPPDEDGSADLRHVLAVARTMSEQITEYMRAIEQSPTWDEAKALLEELAVAVSRFDCRQVLKLLERGVKEYARASEIHDLVWQQRPPVEAAVEAGDSKVTVLADHRAQKQPPSTS
jgi:UDP-N-acetyl-D-mannosaminuronate dehydrogenase